MNPTWMNEKNFDGFVFHIIIIAIARQRQRSYGAFVGSDFKRIVHTVPLSAESSKLGCFTK